MNLNPLKKDDNTDALVKALEDANAAGTAQVAAPVADDAAIATDPQVVSAGVPTPADPALGVETPLTDTALEPSVPELENLSPADSSAVADATSNLSFDGADLPTGISSDADAHLPNTNSEGSGDDSELDEVKNSALEQLRPLIEKLDLEPADKFDKYLMMLRASDDPVLIKPAFDAAQGIEGEKEKAQALLDIINEINYITASQQHPAE
jgi:hypothetical protein